MEKKKKKATLYLPSELNTEILLRLPVKSLIRLKSVCKSWFTLISDTNFANSHFQFSESTQTTRSRILSISGLPPQIRSIDFQALLNDNHSVSPNPNLSLPQSFFPLRIRGSCKGFIFLNCSAYNLLWNPSTGFHKQIPSSPNTRSLFGTNSNLYGFGYDHSRDDYLLVSLYCDALFAEDTSSPLEIFSLRDNIWKQIVDTHRYSCGYQNRKAGLLFNGAIHWFLTGWENVIVAFDLMERKLLKISLPDGLAFHLPDIRLWVFGEFLSLWAIMDGIVEIWVMKEYKVHSSWTKTLVFPIYDIRSFSHDIPYFSPIYSKKNGDIIGTIRGTGLAKYNSKGQLSGHCSYCDDSRGSQAVMYTESLLSLPSDSKQV
ncbi:hypothetical protein TSUD_198560 [Trifolium subterraneum]|uniref:F-box domain-containing protein n=1 Tax=Trifolium subterraneum TaxID=3900 RepID=A0A2Z6MSG3_TRISU|nr:hypothetical protein TSUD_198560 [Trifolium subterraneum]